MNTRYITAIAAAALVLSGCNRDEIVPGASGDGYLKLEVAGVQTVTAVKGALYNSEKEMLDGGLKEFTVQAWNADCSPFVTEQTATYDDDSKWSLTPPVQWTGEDTKTFFAYANQPGGATVTNTFESDDKSQQLEITSLPTDARQQNDIMLGYYSGDGKVDGKDAHTAQIQFYHPLTAVKICDGGIFVKAINRITLSGIYASGTVDVTYKPGVDGKIAPEYEWGSRTGKAAPTLEPKSGEEFEIDPETKVIGVPFVVIPQDVAAGKVRITLDVTVNDDESKTLAVDVPATTWTAGHTKSYILSYGSETSYALSVTEWDENAAGDIELDDKDYQYEFKVSNPLVNFSNTTSAQTKTFQIESYRHEKGDDIIANREPVAFSAEYSTDGGTKWFPFDAAATTATGLSGLLATGNQGAIKASDISLTAEAKTASGDVSATRWVNDLIEATGWDLSRMQIGGEGDGTAQRNTANCYIVKHPGTYILPCVYGNSIQNGVETDKGYKSTIAAGTANVLSNFINAAGNGIVNAWVLQDLVATVQNPKAALLWTDAKVGDELLVHNVKLVNASGADFNWATDAGNQAYIRFQTASKANMVQGNAVVVLYDDTKTANGAYDEGEALWSWHLWVTDADLSAENTGSIDATTKFMCRTLGWCDGPGGSNYRASAPVVMLRLTQNNSATVQTVIVNQADIVSGESYIGGNCTFYQFGRKDPFVGSTGTPTTDQGNADCKPFYNAKGDAAFEVNRSKDSGLFPASSSSATNANKVLMNAIARPDCFVTNNYFDYYYNNLWLANASTNASIAVNAKTVYDPSPYGYCVPNLMEMKKFATSTSVIDLRGSGSVFYGKKFNGSDNLIIPAAGLRESSEKNPPIRSVQIYGNYWASVPQTSNQEKGNLFQFHSQESVSNIGYPRASGFEVRPVLEQ